MADDKDSPRSSSSTVSQRMARAKAIAGLDMPWWPHRTLESGQEVPENFVRGIYSVFAESRSKLGKAMQLFLIVTILLSVVIILVATLPQYRFPTIGTREGDTLPVFATIEAVCVIIFTVEYVTKLLTVPWQTLEEIGVSDPSKGWTKWMPWPLRHIWVWFWSISNLIDFVAIIPFYIELLSPNDVGSLAVLRVLRIGRVTRVIKLGKYSSGVQMLSAVMKNSLQYLYQLTFLISIFVILFGSLIFFAEQGTFVVPSECSPCFGIDPCCVGNSTCVATCGDFDACCISDNCPSSMLDRVCLQTNGYFERPDLIGTGREESPFVSIFTGFYWVFVTVTSVGYGEVVPTTLTGRIISSFVMLAGLVVVALPIVVIVAGFTEWQNDQEKLKREKSAKVVAKTAKDRLEDLVLRFRDLSEEVERVNLSVKRLEEHEANERAALRSLNYRSQSIGGKSTASQVPLVKRKSKASANDDILPPPPSKPSDKDTSKPKTGKGSEGATSSSNVSDAESESSKSSENVSNAGNEKTRPSQGI